MCSYLAKKILSLCKENGDHLKKIVFDKENKEKQIEIRKLVGILNDEKQKIEEKLVPLESEH